jgi:phage protein D
MLLVLAEDALQRARLKRETKVRDNLTLSSLASEIAGDLRLTPQVTALADNIGIQVQLNESSLAFFRRLLARYDADVQVVGSELHVSPRPSVQRGLVELALRGQLREARFRVDLADQVTEVTTSGWDPIRGERIAESSSGSSLGPGTGRTGASIVRDVFGDRREHVAHPLVTTSDEARALAASAFHDRARRFLVLEGKAEGNPLIRVGTHVRVTGVSNRFDNTYYVVSACHRYDPINGYVTEFEAESAYLGAA